MTQYRDFDDVQNGTKQLNYTYDAAGHVATMNDRLQENTVYTYTDAGQVSTITAPGPSGGRTCN